MDDFNSCEFGRALDEMDVEAFLNVRTWLHKALEDAGATITDGGMGAGRADVGFTLNGAPFAIQLKPRVIK